MTGCLAICLLLSAANAWAQFSRDPFTNYALRQMAGLPSIADQIGAVVRDGAAVRREIAQFDARVKDARHKFWAAYPDGNAPPGARADLERALQAKDLFYLMMTLTPAEGAQAAVGFLTGSGVSSSNDPLAFIENGAVDGGIPAAARAGFAGWWRAVSRELGFDGTRDGDMRATFKIADPAALRAALEAAAPVYQGYAARRTFEEYRAQNKRPPGVDPELWRVALIGVDARAASAEKKPDDPYGAAAEALANGGGFRQSCPARVGGLLGIPVTPAKCGCIAKQFDGVLLAGERWDLETRQEREAFLSTAISRVGLADKVAACLR